MPTSPATPAFSQKTENEFRFLADFIPQLVWMTDNTGFHTYFNQRWIDYTGYTLASSVGPAMWNDLLHPDDQDRARQVWGRSLATGADYEIEYRFKGRDGSYRWFLGQALPRRDEAGAIVTWFGTCTDIHDQKLANDTLAEREAEFTTLADNISQFSWMAQPSGHIYWYNKRWYEYIGLDQAAMQNWDRRTVHHPDHLEPVVAFITRGWAKGEPWELTFPLRRHDGEYRWFLTRAVPVRDEHGQLVRWLGTNTDVTEMRQLQEQLQSAYTDLETKVTFRNLDLEHEVQQLRQQLAQRPA